MSHSHSTKLLMNLKDPAIKINDSLTENKPYRGHLSHFIYGTLTYTPAHCPLCEAENKDYSIVKNGTKECIIKWLPLTHTPTYFVLKKQRFLCRNCSRTFTAKSTEIEENCFISNLTKQSIAVEARDKISMKDLAKRHFVSPTTVNRVLKKLEPSLRIDRLHLPKHLCFDEFKSVKKVQGKMSFIYLDAQTHEILDILPNRQLHALRSYFSQFPLSVRKQVQSVVIDMNAPYFIVIQELFPNAKTIIDRFHIVQLMSRSLNQTRIRIMKKFNHSTTYDQKDYTKLKRYWRLILQDSNTLDFKNYPYQSLFKSYLATTDVVDYLLTLDEELKATYLYYQDLLYAFKTADYASFENLLNTLPQQTSNEMKTSIKTLKKHKSHIANTFQSPYSNGPLEGTITKIKALNRIAFGYRSFSSFKRRILLTCRTTKKAA